MKYLYFFKTCLLLSFFLPDMSQAELPIVDGQFTVIEEIEHIPITSEVSIAGHRLCTDGQHLKFRDLKSCQIVESFLQSQGGFSVDCTGDLTISPMAELEIIYTRSGLALQRFFQVQTQYQVIRKERVLGGSDQQFEIVSRKKESLATCEGEQKKTLVYLKNERETLNEIEDQLVQALLRNSISIVNKEQGPLYESHPTSQKENSPFFQTLTLQTPLCNTSLSERDIQSALGGWTGTGGGQSLDMGRLQNLSRPLRVFKNYSSPNQYSMTCE